MVRPRWHDAIIVGVLAVFVAVGVWALWWDDVRAYLHLKPAPAAGSGARPEKSTGEPSSSSRT